ncbi:DoxX family protein [Nonomuraea endophytica]|uniref:Putative membrane protein n=1 Tax=Nonomuraea endophytica TaxID=714136 RepID=A0A7W8AF36_9ACTN|nr:hypothetical protein [Nonomuraea endophytica]MBB5084943.1 putative membrane protein [Nonomuraea endophytica]
MFLTVIVLVVAVLGFRLLGALGVGRFASWPVSAAHGMAVLLVVTASAHFVPSGSPLPMPGHGDMVAMVPPFVPFPSAVVYLTGVLELLGAAGLVLARTRWAAGFALAALFVVMFPANVHAALAGVSFGGDEATPLWFRTPEQVLFIAVALWATKGADRTLLPIPRRRPVAG